MIVNATGRTRSYDLATGAPLWQCGGQVDNPIPSPVARDGVVYCMTGYNGYAIAAIPLDAKGDVTNSDTLRWRTRLRRRMFRRRWSTAICSISPRAI